MYTALWKIIPGPLWVRILIAVAAAAVVIVGLMMFVFPWVDTLVTPRDVTVE
jgi:hypothetical protein